jgi:hypothetical protein
VAIAATVFLTAGWAVFHAVRQGGVSALLGAGAESWAIPLLRRGALLLGFMSVLGPAVTESWINTCAVIAGLPLSAWAITAPV